MAESACLQCPKPLTEATVLVRPFLLQIDTFGKWCRCLHNICYLKLKKRIYPAPELSNLPTIRLFKLKLPTKARKCHFRHFRDKTCVNHKFRLEKGNNCVKIKFFWSLQIVCLK